MAPKQFRLLFSFQQNLIPFSKLFILLFLYLQIFTFLSLSSFLLTSLLSPFQFLYYFLKLLICMHSRHIFFHLFFGYLSIALSKFLVGYFSFPIASFSSCFSQDFYKHFPPLQRHHHFHFKYVLKFPHFHFLLSLPILL